MDLILLSAKMSKEDKHIYTHYFYSSVLEFLYFIIMYIESYGFIFLNRLSKHMRYFKVEVSHLVLSFSGNTVEEKLYEMLNLVNCFKFSENKIKMNEKYSLKKNIFDDIILGKTVDLVLKGFTNLDDICKNLNNNDIIFIDKKNLSNILERSSHFTVENNCSVWALHIHGILGFEDYTSNLIVNYFQNILYHVQTLSYNEIEHHSQFISSCRVHNMLGILCVLFCSNVFLCENGKIKLIKKSKKYPKQKPLLMKSLSENSSPTAVPVGKIVHGAYGSYIQRWTGEIGCLSKSSGYIYCVTDFTNGNQGVFSVYFNKSVLKVISEICNLKEYLQIRDIVEFDAMYYDSKKLDNYWRATRVKILNTTRIVYDEILFDKLRYNAELQRKKCADNKCCLNSTNSLHTSNNHIGRINNVTEVCNLFPAVTEYGSYDLDSIKDKSEIRNNVSDKYVLPNQISSNPLNMSFPNLLLPDYLFLFGHVFMLMADKGIAIAKHEDKLFNILFLRDSIYPANKSQIFFVKGQKILALIPYIDEIKSFTVATFVYGLNDGETEITEKNCIEPTDFTFKTFLPNMFKDVARDCCNKCCNIQNSLLVFQPRNSVVNLRRTAQILLLHNFLVSQYKISFDNLKLLKFLNSLFKSYCGEIMNNGIICPIIKLSKCLMVKYTVQKRIQDKHTRKLKRLQRNLFCTESGYERVIPLKLCDSSVKLATTENLSSNTNLRARSKSLDLGNGSCSSLCSYKTCGSTFSSETFYSCEIYQKKLSNENSSKISRSLPDKINSLNDNETEYEKSARLFVCDDKPVTSLRTISDNKFPFKLENFDEYLELNTGKNNDKPVTPLSTLSNSELTFKFENFDEYLELNTEKNNAKPVTPLSTVSNSELTFKFENFDQYLELKKEKDNLKNEYKKVRDTKHFSLRAFPFLKNTFGKHKRRTHIPNALKPVCENCYKGSVKTTACVSLITDSFFFYNVNLNNCNVVLPFPKRVVPDKLQEKIKLNSCNEIVVASNVLGNLSHILVINIIC